jgi:hypothetical protein
MFKKIYIAVFCLSLTMFLGCSGDSSGNSATSNTNQANLPDGMNTKPVQPDGKTTPGIPDPKTVDVNKMPKGTTPTPGIPDPKTIGKTPVPQGATPTPGIPSKEELEKQRKRKVDINEVNNPATKSDSETTSPIDRKRRAGKPSGN